jgi:cytochrome c553
MLESFEGATRRKILAIAFAVSVGLVGIAFALGLGPVGEARSAENALPVGDVTAGKATAATCAACHGIDGISRQAGVPHLAGQHASYIQGALLAYKNGTRKDERMQQVVGAVSEQDIANVAAYYASLEDFSSRPKEPGAEAAATAEPDPYAAVKEATAVCAGCHGEDGNSRMPGTPSLAGQHASYLTLAINAYLDGSRNVPMMQALVKPLSQGDIENIAYFFAAMEPRRSDTPATGDPYAGVAVTAPCAACHGQDGNSSDPKIPRLAGLDAQYLEATVNAYKDGTRTHDVMRSQVSALREQDIKDLAAYYAGKEPQALPVPKLLTVAEWTERCSRCHGANGNSTDARFPVLAGQDDAYLAKAMALYHLGDRPNTLMFAMSFPMTESDIKKLAAYYAQQRKD